MRFILSLTLTTLMMTGCANDPSKDVTPARVSDNQPAPKTAPKAAQPTAQPKQPNAAPAGLALGGEITFVGSKVTGSHTGRFTNWIGTAELDAGGQLSSLSIVVQTKDLEADYEAPTKWTHKLEAHLRDDDFFASAQFPTATFQLNQVTPNKDATAAGTHQLGGKLTLRGVAKAITFPATISSDKPFSASAEFSINRKDFGILYSGKKDNLIRDGVVLKINLRAK